MKIQFFTKPDLYQNHFLVTGRCELDDGSQFTQSILVDISAVPAEATLSPSSTVAELMAMQHFVLHSNWFSHLSGTPMHLICSNGRTKKALQSRTGTFADKLAAPLRLVLDQATFYVDNQDPGWESQTSHAKISYSSLYTNTHISAQCSLGNVRLTATAIESFKSQSLDPVTAPLKQLIRTLQRPLSPTRLPRRVQAKKARKYPDSNRNMEYLSAESLPWIFVFKTCSATSKTLVTCYRK